MRALFRILRILLGADPKALARGAALSLAVLVMGAALLGLSGWVITATGLAGLAGIGIAFDVFRPGAGVRFLALGRTFARYGERLLPHDATLRALAALRVSLLERHGKVGARGLASLRSEGVLTRLIADVDALDGVVLRLFLPVVAGLITHVLVFGFLWWLVGLPVAAAIAAGYLPAAALIIWWLTARGLTPSAVAEAESQALRRGMIDMIRDREALILSGRLGEREAGLVAVDAAARAAAKSLDRADRGAASAITALISAVAALSFVAGAWLLSQGQVGAALAGMGIFVALALGETVLPLRRGFGELGRMIGAASRVDADAGIAPQPVAEDSAAPGAPQAPVPLLAVDHPRIAFNVDAGEALAITGPSGSGKTTLLMEVAGLMPTSHVKIGGRPPADWEEDTLREALSGVPQRSGLVAGSIRDNLSISREVEDDEMWAALEAVDLASTLAEREGLDTFLGEAGSGLSGGQAKRLSLARAIVNKPKILLLDEPTEGLDEATADRVRTGIRAALPEAAIVAVLHRGAEHPVFDARQNLHA